MPIDRLASIKAEDFTDWSSISAGRPSALTFAFVTN